MRRTFNPTFGSIGHCNALVEIGLTSKEHLRTNIPHQIGEPWGLGSKSHCKLTKLTCIFQIMIVVLVVVFCNSSKLLCISWVRSFSLEVSFINTQFDTATFHMIEKNNLLFTCGYETHQLKNIKSHNLWREMIVLRCNKEWNNMINPFSFHFVVVNNLDGYDCSKTIFSPANR